MAIETKDIYASIWEPNPLGIYPNYITLRRMTSSEFKINLDQLTARGYRPFRVNGYTIQNKILYSASWESYPDSPYWQIRWDMNLDDFQQIYNEFDDQGYVPRYIDGYGIDGEAFYAAIWVQMDDDLNVRYNLTPQQLEQFNREMDDHRFEPIQISGYTVNGQSRYAAMFRAVRINKRKTLRYEMDQATFNQVYNELHSQGYVPIQISSFNNGDEITRYAAVWFKSGQEDEGIVVKLELAYDQYIQFILEMQNKKYVLFDEAPSGIFG